MVHILPRTSTTLPPTRRLPRPHLCLGVITGGTPESDRRHPLIPSRNPHATHILLSCTSTAKPFHRNRNVTARTTRPSTAAFSLMPPPLAMLLPGPPSAAPAHPTARPCPCDTPCFPLWPRLRGKKTHPSLLFWFDSWQRKHSYVEDL